ncbi:Gag-Pol polyprotein [Nosema granulosis]|uniref:Gag-Pol polyprotein n=1 Tax=Nosema granulosis TaxID=83296 RepID=A0A9P6GWJ6_9MICR|nr:Gag-Pol polyprotein [Nosema granulosis]
MRFQSVTNGRGCSRRSKKHVRTVRRVRNSVIRWSIQKNKAIETTKENELWDVDLIGRIDDKGKNKFIFIGIDHFSKWIETKIINYKTGEEIVKAIEELIIKKHGPPQRILSDCGLESCNKAIKTLIDKHKLRWEYASPFHHQTTGAVERRAIQAFMNKLKKLTNYGIQKWTKRVEADTLAFNLSFNRAIGNSPSVLKYGRLPELNIDKDLFQPRIWLSKKESQGKKKKIFERYRQQIIKSKITANKNFNVGDKVSIFRKKQNKMDTNWHTGFVIKKKISEDAFLVSKNKSTMRVNKGHIRLKG